MSATAAVLGMARRLLSFVALGVCVLLSWAAPTFAADLTVAPGKDTAPRAALHCGYSLYHSQFPLGGVIVNEIDVPGPHGNEINNIFAVMDANRDILGWIYTSFNGNVMFEPLAKPGSNTLRVASTLPKVRKTFNAAGMLQAAFSQQRKFTSGYITFDSAVNAARNKRAVPSTLVPCFAHSWNGNE